MNYLQYLSYYFPKRIDTCINYLVSGVDPKVRKTVGHNIIDFAYTSGKTLFIVDNTQSGSEITNFGRFRVMNILDSNINLCQDLLETSNIEGISRLRSLLADLGFESTQAMKVVNYLSFVKETEHRLGNSGLLSVETLKEYSSTALVKWKLQKLIEIGRLSKDSYDYLLIRYSEVSAAAADFEMFLVMLSPFLSGTCKPSCGTAVHLPVGDFVNDSSMQKILCKLMMSFVKKQPENCTVLIIDDGRGDRNCLIDIMKTFPTNANAHLLTTDAFSLSEGDLNLIMNVFNVRVYSRHDNMASCGKIESLCGYIDIVKRSYTVTVDKRIRASNAFDMLLGTNRTESEMRNAPVRESRFRKEVINSLGEGSAIIDCGGTQVIFQF